MGINSIKQKISGITDKGKNSAYEMRAVLTDITDTFSGATGNTVALTSELTNDGADSINPFITNLELTAATSSIVTTFSGLTDTVLTGVTDNHIVQYDITTQSWNSTPQIANTSELTNDGENGINPFTTIVEVYGGSVLLDANYYLIQNFEYFVYANKYVINGTLFSTYISDTLTLSGASGQDRIDVITITTGQTFNVVQGVPSANPIKPDIDGESEIELTFVLVQAGTTTPADVFNDLIYDENLGTGGGEWNTSVSSAQVVTNYGGDSQSGSLSIAFSAVTTGDYVTFDNNGFLSGDDLSNIVFRLKLLNVAPHRLGIRLYNTTTGQVGLNLGIDNGFYGFNSTSIGNWQTIIVPKTVLGVNGMEFDRIRLFTRRAGVIFLVDNVIAQNGTLVITTGPTITSTSELINDGPDGVNPYITNLDLLTGGTFNAGTLTLNATNTGSTFNVTGFTDTSEWATYSGTRAGSDLLVTLGDYDDSGNGTKITLIDSSGNIILASNNGFNSTQFVVNGFNVELSGIDDVTTPVNTASIGVGDGSFFINQNDDNIGATTSVDFISPIGNVNLRFPAKTTGSYILATTSDIPTIDDTAYGVSWDTNLDGASKNAIYDKIETLGVSPYTLTGTTNVLLANGVGNPSMSTGATYNVISAGLTNSITGNTDYSVISGGRNNVTGGDYTFIGGGFNNLVTSYAGFIGGGENHIVSGLYGTIAGGSVNTASGNYSTISGGYENTISSTYGFIGGGENNSITGGTHSVIAGGKDNIAGGDYYNTIAGGLQNTVSGGYFNTISGGRLNTNSGYYSTIAGGQKHNISGGYNNTISGGYQNTTSGYYNTIGGGNKNTSSGYYSTIAGGDRNTITGRYSFIGGGLFNEANSYGEIALGIYPTIISGNASTWVGSDRLFNLGNGKTSGTKSDAFTIYKDGRIEAPSLAISGITGNTQLITKEYADANYSGGGGGITGATNGLSASTSNVKLGGPLTDAVTYIGESLAETTYTEGQLIMFDENDFGGPNTRIITTKPVYGATGTTTGIKAQLENRVTEAASGPGFYNTAQSNLTSTLVGTGTTTTDSFVGTHVGYHNVTLSSRTSRFDADANYVDTGINDRTNQVNTNGSTKNSGADWNCYTYADDTNFDYVGTTFRHRANQNATTGIIISSLAQLGSDGDNSQAWIEQTTTPLISSTSIKTEEYTLGSFTQILQETESTTGSTTMKFVLNDSTNQLTINQPTSYSGTTSQFAPISVNGIFADATGNISSGGGTDNAAVIFSPTGNTSAITKSGSTIYYPLGANAVNLGWNNQVEYSGATGDWSFSFGRNPTANGDYSIAGGYVSKGLGTGSVGIGYSANATGPYATALGRSTIASGNTSFAAMYLNKANGDNSLALGQYNTANSFGETVSGVYGTITSGNKTGFNVNDRLFNIGNGTSNASRSDAFTINKDGRIYAPSLTIAEITGNTQLITKEYGDTTYLGGAGAVVFAATGNTTGLVIYNRDEANYGSVGFHAVDLSYSNTPSSTVGATNNYSFATSLNATASGYASIAMGYLTLANNVSSVAIGRGASATGQAAICFGQNTSASGQNSTASGYGSIASGYTSTASGNYTISGNFASTASGYKTTASGYYSFAGGRSTVAESYGEMSIGVWPTLYTGDATAWVGADRIFNVGNGISDGSRSNVLTILKYGDVIAPSLTTAIIASADTKVLITKEYADANYSGGGAYTYSGTSIYPSQSENYTITSDSNVIGGGQNNTSSGYWSVIGGGDGNIANNVHSTVSAGYQNTASNYYSAIVDGKQNTNSGYYGFIGNGRVNNIEDNYGFIGSGNDNIIIGGGANSGIGSGRFNTISGNTSFSFIAAGENNIAKHNNTFVLGSNVTTTTGDTTYIENLIGSGTSKMGGYTVATLPSRPAGTRTFVTDSTVAASGNFGATVAGTGSNTVPVFYDGTNWIIA